MNAWKSVETVIHPISKRMVRGKRLAAGTVLESTDLYTSSTGAWEECPCPGLVLEEGVETIWVRPDRK